MSFITSKAHSWAMLILGLLLCLPTVQGGLIPIEYCSTLSTAMTPTNTSIYQSQGLCFDFCKTDYAVGIVQGDACWCSNFIPDPSTQLDIKKCNKQCIGFPGDLCGDVNDGTFVYVKGFKEPEGIRKGQGPTKPGGQQPGTTPAPGPPVVSTVTADGIVKTVTVPGTSGTGLANQGEVTSQNNGGLNTGATVGIAIGVVLIVIIALAIAFFIWRRKKQQHDDAVVYDDDMAVAGTGGRLRRASSGGFTSEKMGPGSVGRRPTMQSSHHPEGSLHSDSSARRRSHLMPIDPRIDPGHSGIYARDENASHDSINTLRDDQDYSRRVHAPKVLRATNPDPDY